LDDEPERIDTERHRRRVAKRYAGDDVFRSAHVGHDRLDRPPASAETRERERRAHQLQHRPTGDAVGGVGGPFWKFALEGCAEFRAVLELTEASPIRAARDGGGGAGWLGSSGGGASQNANARS